MFLEVTDSKAGSSEWSCFVSHRLSVVNQKFEGDRLVHFLPGCIVPIQTREEKGAWIIVQQCCICQLRAALCPMFAFRHS